MAENPKFKKLLQRMQALHDKKNADYAGANPFSNFEEAAVFAGVDVDTVFRVLLGVKQARIKELTSSGKTPNFESIADSRFDFLMYCALREAYNEPLD